MEFLVIVLFVVAIVVVNFMVVRAQRRKGSVSGEAAGADGVQEDLQRTAKPQKAPRKAAGAKAAQAGARTSAEAAREANARLNAVQHQQVYAAIAQGHPIAAVKLYAQFTGLGVRAAAAAVENLAMHPQPFLPPRPAGSASDASAPVGAAADAPAPAEPAADAPDRETPAPRSDSASTPGAESQMPDSVSGSEGSAAPAGRQAGPAGKKPATPEEDEISKWVKNLRPEDF